MSGKLVITRHGETELNAKGIWAGIIDTTLTNKGHEDAKLGAQLIKHIPFDTVYITPLIRTKETYDDYLKIFPDSAKNTPIITSKELIERNYGDFAGQNKWEVQEQVGEEKFQQIRRSYTYVPKNGESLEMVYNRTTPYYKTEILPKLLKGENILIIAHGNSDRALIKYIENISDEDIAKREMELGTIMIYTVDEEGKAKTIEHLKADIAPIRNK